MTGGPILPPNIDEEKQATAHAAAGDSFTDPRIVNALKIDMQKFTKTTKDTTELFFTIHSDLVKFDKEGLEKPIAPAWGVLQTQYRNLLWSSRDLATEIAVAATQFNNNIIPLANAVKKEQPPAEQTKKEIDTVVAVIDDYIVQNSMFAEMVKAQADGFSQLGGRVTSFFNDFEKFGAKLELENKAKIEQLTRSIDAANNALKDVEKEVIAAGVALGLSLLVTAALIFIPGVGWGAVAAGVTAIGGSAVALGILEEKAKKLRDQIASETAERARLQDQNALILRIREALGRIHKEKIPTIAGGLKMFNEIWSSVNYDIVSIRKYLMDVKAGHARGAPPVILVANLKSANTLYMGLAKALSDYATGLANAGATPH